MNAIIDTTLREGEQTPGITFTIAEKQKIITGLAEAGIKEMELGIAATLIDCPAQLLDYCRTHHPGLSCSLWARCAASDIRIAATLQPDLVSLSIPVSDILIRDKLAKDREWTASRLAESIALAKSMGLAVAVGFEDATRADRGFLRHMAGLADTMGAIRLRLADTVGDATPAGLTKLVGEIASVVSRSEITVHCHNDFGMATANAVSALANGASGADVTLLGLGERCGCTRLEELAGFLRLKKAMDFDLQKIAALARYTAAITGREIPPNQPFTGEAIFTCETGLHLHALYKNPATYEPYPPEIVGAIRKLILSGKAGRKAIISHLAANGYPIDADIDDTLVRKVRDALAQGILGDHELAAHFPA